MTTFQTTTSWVAGPRHDAPARLRLFCFPYAGGGAAVFRTWRYALPTDVAIHPIQLPGRESRLREPSFTHIEPLVRALAHSLLPQLDEPFAFFGHSMGALVSFELARYLRRHHGIAPRRLFVSAHRAPQIPNPEPGIYQLPEPEFINKLRSLNGTSDEVFKNPDLMDLMLPILRADFTICGTYRYADDAPLDCPITAFGGMQDPLARHDQLAAWRDQTRADFSLRMIPGDHFFIHKAQPLLLWAVGQELQQMLAQPECARCL